VREEHDDAFTADVNGAENIRLDITDENNSESSSDLGGHRGAGWLAQSGVSLQELSSEFQPQEKW